ncbi:hypothetical protein LPYR103PRE_20160 [Segatella asaccharophila]
MLVTYTVTGTELTESATVFGIYCADGLFVFVDQAIVCIVGLYTIENIIKF